MKFNKILAGVLACCVIGAIVPNFSAVVADIPMTANAADYTEGTEGVLTYRNYGEYIEITACDQSAESVVIPDKIEGVPVTSIGDGAFWRCENLTKVTIPNSVTIIDEGAFADCSALKKIAIPDGVTRIGAWAFECCTELEEITIPDSVTSIGGRAFADTPWLASKQKDDPLVIVNDILVDGNACSGDVIVPVSVTSISIAFYNCPELTSITILDPNCEIFDSRETISNGPNEENFSYFNGTIYGYENSTAQAYAEKYGKKFESLGEVPEQATTTTTTSTTTKNPTTTTTTQPTETIPTPEQKILLGDINGDNIIDSSDATDVLVDYSLTSTGKESQLTDAQKAAADVDNDGKIDSSDASYILKYYAYTSTGGKETDMSKWMAD